MKRRCSPSARHATARMPSTISSTTPKPQCLPPPVLTGMWISTLLATSAIRVWHAVQVPTTPDFLRTYAFTYDNVVQAASEACCALFTDMRLASELLDWRMIRLYRSMVCVCCCCAKDLPVYVQVTLRLFVPWTGV